MEGYKRNRNYLESLLQTYIPSVVFLQEIWLPFHEVNLLNNNCLSHTFEISTPDMFTPNEDKMLAPGPIWHGAAIGWHDDISSDVTALASNHDRFCAVRISTASASRTVIMISLYAPTSGKDDEFLECIDHLSEFILINLSENENIVIGADTNCSTKSSSKRRQAWKVFCDSFSLESKSGSEPTFHHHNGTSQSSIDMFVTSKSLKIPVIHHLCTLETPENLSSHDALISSISIPTKKPMKSKYDSTYSQFNREKVIWDDDKIEEYQMLAAKALSDASKYWSTPECIPLLCSLYSNLLVTSAKLVFKIKTVGKLNAKPTKSKRVEAAENNLEKQFEYWKRAGRPMSKENSARLKYTRARSLLQQLNRYEENLRNVKVNNQLISATIHDRNKVYSVMKSLRNEHTKAATSMLETPVGTYYGKDILEGFSADAEHLGKATPEDNNFDNEFYNLCRLDNLFIFTFKGTESVKIPAMTKADLDSIIKNMKLGKACDFYKMTAEHLKNCGTEAQTEVLNLINRIINDIYFLTCPQIKIGLGTNLHKGRKKPKSKSKSYRRITVTPLIGSILDKYVDPIAEAIFQIVQSPDQLGFTAKLNYLMASVQRGECQRWAIDNKHTCFGVSLDGEAAFPSVEREIQVRELYSVGERGDILEYSRNTYENTECYIKHEGLLGRKISEYKGNRQGHSRASGHYKAYINPCLLALNESKLGFYIGPICVTAVTVADDTYVLSGTPSGLQAALNIVSFFGKRYRIIFNADKTKLVVTGSQIDMNYYRDITKWTLNDETIAVCEDNEHLGLVVSGSNEEQKNVDSNIQECRKSLLGLLGPAFAYKCLLPPTVKSHLWRIYNLPILSSGLSALPVRPTYCKSLTIFHNKILRGFLQLSQTSPIPALHFLLGELPVEARLHMEVMSVFYNIWCNPQTTIFRIVQYLLKMSDHKSTTWSAHVRLLCLRYSLPDPLQLLSENPWSKAKWKLLVKTKIVVYFENKLRAIAKKNSKMNYLNVQISGLSGSPHTALININTTQDALRLRCHLKFITEN